MHVASLAGSYYTSTLVLFFHKSPASLRTHLPKQSVAVRLLTHTHCFLKEIWPETQTWRS